LALAQGLAVSLEQAARLIMAGEIFLRPSNPAALPVRVNKPGESLPVAAELLRRSASPYVSRGAYKLLGALEHFGIQVEGMVALDAGASTGGFVDCLLQRGAARVYAADVGRGLLHERLCRDSRVIRLEGVNLRLAGPGFLPEAVDMITADLSFISLKAVLPALKGFMKPGAGIIALIKPQFEVRPGQTVRGVVRDEDARLKAVDEVTAFARDAIGLMPQGVMPSPLKGARGNQEYLAWFVRPCY
jgi:23S rRNA (cytidine1920-2'-O)/16S rRNA (cytidine1409-2'-O)-methyltransferase